MGTSKKKLFVWHLKTKLHRTLTSSGICIRSDYFVFFVLTKMLLIHFFYSFSVFSAFSIPKSSTSKINVEYGLIASPAPRSPYARV